METAGSKRRATLKQDAKDTLAAAAHELLLETNTKEGLAPSGSSRSTMPGGDHRLTWWKRPSTAAASGLLHDIQKVGDLLNLRCRFRSNIDLRWLYRLPFPTHRP